MEVRTDTRHDVDGGLVGVGREHLREVGRLHVVDVEGAEGREDRPHALVKLGGALRAVLLELLEERDVVVLRAVAAIPREELVAVVAEVVVVQRARACFEGEQPVDTLPCGLRALCYVVCDDGPGKR